MRLIGGQVLLMPGFGPYRPARVSPGSSKALRWLAAGLCPLASAQVAAAQPTPDLAQIPAPSRDPLRIDFSNDPILRLSDSAMPFDEFRAVVAAALARHPGRLEAIASEEEAEAARDEARERLLPSGELTISTYKTLAREFSD